MPRRIALAHSRPETTPRTMNRREAIGLFGAAGAVLFAGCGASNALVNSDGGAIDSAAGPIDSALPPVDSATPSCVLDPNVTKGPYWVDEMINRSTITSDSNGKASPNPRPGLPLTLRFGIYSFNQGACAPLPNAQVDVWHCDATGIYSDSTNMGMADTTGQNFLRGYQITDANGAVSFTTIYPGWYSGRTIHVHVKIRLFDNAKNTTTEATTQVFFSDAITDSVFAAVSPYSARGARDTRNATDNVYENQTVLLLDLKGSPLTGYIGSSVIGVKMGTVNEG